MGKLAIIKYYVNHLNRLAWHKLMNNGEYNDFSNLLQELVSTAATSEMALRDYDYSWNHTMLVRAKWMKEVEEAEKRLQICLKKFFGG